MTFTQRQVCVYRCVLVKENEQMVSERTFQSRLSHLREISWTRELLRVTRELRNQTNRKYTFPIVTPGSSEMDESKGKLFWLFSVHEFGF